MTSVHFTLQAPCWYKSILPPVFFKNSNLLIFVFSIGASNQTLLDQIGEFKLKIEDLTEQLRIQKQENNVTKRVEQEAIIAHLKQELSESESAKAAFEIEAKVAVSRRDELKNKVDLLTSQLEEAKKEAASASAATIVNEAQKTQAEKDAITIKNLTAQVRVLPLSSPPLLFVVILLQHAVHFYLPHPSLPRPHTADLPLLPCTRT